jgi:putative thioredoxin
MIEVMQPSRPGRPDPRVAAQQAQMAAAMAGAVDLGAVKARSEAAARAQAAPPPSAAAPVGAPGSAVVDVTEATFQAEVLDRSFQVPVLLVLTTPRAPSAAALVTAFENVVNGAGGAVVLRTVDVDANPRIVQALQVQGVPASFAVIGGQLVPGFEGVLPEEQVREFVAAVLQAAREQGLEPGAPDGAEVPSADAPEEPEDPRFAAAEQALDAGDFEAAAERYRAILDQEPANAEAALALGQVRLLQRLEGIDPAAAARADAAPDDVEAQLVAADLLFAGNDIAGALDRLLATVSRTSGDDRERVRTRLLEFFDLLGPDDPRVPPARRQLARSLF